MTPDPSNQPPLIAQLLTPGCYPHPVVEPIRLGQTHISYVLLTGDYVYKIKKPVNPGFLDFTTLERRRHFCHEEVRLNRRGAPEAYLDVVAICQEGDDFKIGGNGTTIEFAVKMRQFPQEGLFSSMLECGRL